MEKYKGGLGDTPMQHAWMEYCDAEEIPHDHEDEEPFKWGFDAGRRSELARLRTELAESQRREEAWIPVEERLPETPNPWPAEVLAYLRVGERHFFTVVAKFFEGEWTDAGGKQLEGPLATVTAWMPLPPPYIAAALKEIGASKPTEAESGHADAQSRAQ